MQRNSDLAVLSTPSILLVTRRPGDPMLDFHCAVRLVNGCIGPDESRVVGVRWLICDEGCKKKARYNANNIQKFNNEIR